MAARSMPIYREYSICISEQHVFAAADERCERSGGAVVEEEGDGVLWRRWRMWALSETAAVASLA